MRIFFTGSSGFIGRHLLPLLGAHEVLCLSRTGAAYPKGRAPRTVLGDLQHPESYFAELRRFRPECCIHLAWSGLPDYSLANCQANLAAGIALLDTLHSVGCGRIVAAGTCWEYGAKTGLVSESTTVGAQGLFAAFKSALHSIGASMYESSGRQLAWARIFFTYGPGQRATSLIPHCHQCFKNGVQPKVAAPHAANDFVHVEDVASALRVLTESDDVAGVYNIGSGRASAVWEVVNLVARQMDRSPVFPGAAASAPGLCADTAKIRALGWTPRFTLETGIAQTLQALDSGT